MRRAVFLDRDGVLNEVTTDESGVPHPPQTLDAVRICADAPAACQVLREAGYLLIMVTNQPDVARGTQEREVVEAINSMVRERLALDDVMCCYHDDADGCSCRKPQAGLLREAAERWQIDLGRSFVVGDRWTDIAAGKVAGCWTFLVSRAYSGSDRTVPDGTGASLADAARWILQPRNGDMRPLSELRIKLFADGADLGDILELSQNPLIAGFTTNPTLMRHAGVTDYSTFARRVLEEVPDRPISLEVLADDFVQIEEQACVISSWADNVYVKIPVTNCQGEPSTELLHRLAERGVKVNATALMTLEQVERVRDALADGPPSFVSLFAGRIADTGRDPVPIVHQAVVLLRETPHLELIWASPRELLNIFHADAAGCHVITATSDILRKLPYVGKDLNEFSLETVRMFYGDAQAAGYTLAAADEAAAIAARAPMAAS